MQQYQAVILAAGEGKRMKSKYSKLVHKACGRPLIQWVLSSVEQAGIEASVLVVGHKREQVMEVTGETVAYAVQDKQLGTGHAVMQAADFIRKNGGNVLVLCGDTPMVTSDTLKAVMEYHSGSGNTATVITAVLEDATGYGRIVRNADGSVARIVEHKDANEETRKIKEVNSGMYCFEAESLLAALTRLTNKNSQGEYYLTDTIEILISQGKRTGAYIVGDASEISGINDRVQLAAAETVLRKRINEAHMRAGVTIIDAASTYIDAEVDIGKDTIVYPGCILEGKTKIGSECSIGPNSRIVASVIEDEAEIMNSVVLESAIGEKTHVGPFAYIRPGSHIGRKVKIGDFVEVKKSVIGDKTKVSHLSYIGDAEVGSNVNVGCGVVVVNYDGKKKHKTIVGDNAFVGCNVNLVSPVRVGDNAYIAAGSTITDEVPENALAIARSRQVVKDEWVIRRGLSRKEDKKED